MNPLIIVAGATGNLGTRICRELIKRDAQVKALVRAAADPEKVKKLQAMGVQVIETDLSVADIAAKSSGAECTVSALAGLREVIVDLQKRFLDGAIKAGVKRFVPSDFCTDYTDLIPGENRNFDLRREFRSYLDTTGISASSVFNGAFADILKYNTPLLNLKDKSITYWGDKADWKLDFTTMDNVAAFTAEVALDPDPPRDLQIASFQVSPVMIREGVKEITGEQFGMQQQGSMENFASYIKEQRTNHPEGENELYAKWQQAQYMYSMFATQHHHLANNRYQNLSWTTGTDYLKTFLK